MSTYSFKCYRIEFDSDFSNLNVIHRISGEGETWSLTGNTPVRINVSSTLDEFYLENAALEDPSESATLDLTQNPSFEVQSESYTGVGTSDIRDLRQSHTFVLYECHMSIQKIGEKLEMKGKGIGDNDFYFQMDRATATTAPSECA